MNKPTKRLFRRWMLLPMIAAFFLLSATVAQAHEFYDGGYRSRTMGIATSGVNSSWASWVSPSMSSWNNAGVSANITAGGAYANYMCTANLDRRIVGIYEPLTWTSGASHRTTKFRIRLNTDYNDMSSINKRQTIVHELGHALGLGHEDVAASVMRSWTSDYYYPTTDDKNAVIAAWR